MNHKKNNVEEKILEHLILENSGQSYSHSNARTPRKSSKSKDTNGPDTGKIVAPEVRERGCKFHQ